MAADHMLENREQFEPFWLSEEPASGGDGGTFEQYCQKMRSTGEWGGELELRALAEAL